MPQGGGRRSVVIVGSGETAQMAHEYLTDDSPHDVVAFAVDGEHRTAEAMNGLPVVNLESLTEAYPPSSHAAFVAVSSTHLNRARRRLFDLVKDMSYECVSYVSSRTFVGRDVSIGENCFVLENNVLQRQVEIGDNTVLWSGNHIGHRTVIGNDVFIASHVVVSGFCEIGDRTFVGVNASFADEVKVAADCVVGMGAVVTKDLPDEGLVYVGAPARAAGSAFDSFDVPESMR